MIGLFTSGAIWIGILSSATIPKIIVIIITETIAIGLSKDALIIFT